MMKKYASEYSGCQIALRRIAVALCAVYDIWNRCGKTQLPSAMLMAEVISQIAVVGEVASSPGNLPMPGCCCSAIENRSISEAAPTLLATVALSSTTTTTIRMSLTPAAKAAERTPAANTKAIISTPAPMVAASLEMLLPSVSCTISPRLTSWICTYTTSDAMPTTPVSTPSHGAS
jgi:hypothetical protein